jgi:GNAT superfamily N-acetyltransferase
MLEALTTLQVELLRSQIVEVYAAAFASAPYFKTRRETDDFASWLPQHLLRPNFRFVAALDEETGGLVGFAYGYSTVPGQWWHEQVSRALGEARAREWLSDAFQLSEIAVAPDHQGRGLGRQLHERVLGLQGDDPGPLPNTRAVLSTLRAETVALGMYQRHGWETLLDAFVFPGVQRVYRILGLAELAADTD